MNWLLSVILLSILPLGGCGSTGNPNAPISTAPHETAWVTYHRKAIVSAKGVTAQPVVDGTLIREHVIQCQACHGANLLGAKAGATGPACLDCHVLDPVKYPILCYSCHGKPVGNPLTFLTYSATRDERPPGLPLDPAFINRVRTGSIHLKHAAVPNITNDKCAMCHGEANIIGEIHHNKVMNDLKLGCLGPLPSGCHTFDLSNFTLVIPDCNSCHIPLP